MNNLENEIAAYVAGIITAMTLCLIYHAVASVVGEHRHRKQVEQELYWKRIIGEAVDFRLQCWCVRKKKQ